jgi:hypothetical protein
MAYQSLRVTLLVIAAFVLLLAAGSGQILAQEAETIQITYPAPDQTVSGLITLAGSVTFSDFLKYEVFLKRGQELIWAATVYSPVIDGNLARLDTRTFIDGTYQLVIRQVHTDSQYTDYTGPSFTISNSLGAPRPFPEVEPNFLYPVEGKALVRVRNCSGEDFSFDYGSPESAGRESGQLNLPPKPEDTICPFSDIALQPGEYRGTGKGGSQTEAVTYSLMAEAGKIYQIIYNGPGAGANELYIGPIDGDEPALSDTDETVTTEPATEDVSTIATPVVATGAAPAVDMVVASPPTPAPTLAPSTSDPVASGEALAKTQAMLPVSGQGAESRTAFVIAAVVLILFLVIGGVWTARNRNYTA